MALSILEEDNHGYKHIVLLQDDADAPAEFLGYPVIGNRTFLDTCKPEQYHVFPTSSTPPVRKVMADYLNKRGFDSPTLISPHALVKRTASIGRGCLINDFAFIGHFTQIGNYALVSSYVIVGHDSQVGDYSSLYVRTSLLGYTQVGTGCLLGAGSHLYAYRAMGDGSSASMGSMIFEDVPAFAKVAGNPATLIKQYTGYKTAALRPLPSG